MEFKISLNFGSKKSAVTEFDNKTTPEKWGDSYFYPILSASEQNNKALILMYNELPEIQAPVNYIIDTLTTIPYKHYEIKGKEKREIENSQVIETLENPNQYLTEDDFIKMFFLNRIMLGIGYINAVKPLGLNNVSQLYILPTQDTEPNLETSGSIDIRQNKIISYSTILGGMPLEIDVDNVFAQRETSLITDNYTSARSRLMSAIYASESLRYNYEARIKLLADRGAVGLISPADQNATLTKDEALSLREQFYSSNGITGNRYPFHVGSRALNFTPTSMNAGELELNPNQQRDLATVCNILGLDPILFGVGTTTYNNKKLADTSAYEKTIIPYFNNYLQLIKKVFGLPKNQWLEADYSSIKALQEDQEKVVNANSKMYNDGVIDDIEYREATGYQGGQGKFKESNQGTQGNNQE